MHHGSETAVERHHGASLARRIAGSASILAGRQAVVQIITALSTVVVSRALGGEQFGVLASAMAVFYLALAASDFGFGFVLARDLAVTTDRGALFRAALRVQFGWSTLLAAGVFALGLSGIAASTEAKPVIMILAAGVLLAGLSGGRQVFLVYYRTGLLTLVDITINLLTVMATITAVLLGAGPKGAAVAAVAGIGVNSVVVLVLALRLVGPAGARMPRSSVLFLRRALPFGLASFMTSVYFTIDLALLGWLVAGQRLGDYAVATKVLSLLVVVPGLIMNAAVPGLAGTVGDRLGTTALVSRLAHWMAATGLPACVAAAIFAPQLIGVVFGSKYAGATELTRILVLAAILALATNIVGITLGAAGVVRPLLIQNAAAVVFNVGGNLLLVPRYGVIASAWLTVATELFVLVTAAIVIRDRVDLRGPLRAVVRPSLAVGGASLIAIGLGGYPLVAIVASMLTFGVAIALLRAWPVELTPLRRRPNVAADACGYHGRPDGAG
jgi:O-antigen/teichoic acid export membrane protein